MDPEGLDLIGVWNEVYRKMVNKLIHNYILTSPILQVRSRVHGFTSTPARAGLKVILNVYEKLDLLYI